MPAAPQSSAPWLPLISTQPWLAVMSGETACVSATDSTLPSAVEAVVSVSGMVKPGRDESLLKPHRDPSSALPSLGVFTALEFSPWASCPAASEATPGAPASGAEGTECSLVAFRASSEPSPIAMPCPLAGVATGGELGLVCTGTALIDEPPAASAFCSGFAGFSSGRGIAGFFPAAAWSAGAPSAALDAGDRLLRLAAAGPAIRARNTAPNAPTPVAPGAEVTPRLNFPALLVMRPINRYAF